ncbi:serine hydrolase domain-containing protein [Natronoflexus pectinivorans]|uniref:Beta-lactamase n=1 Tax=Natronoflexus pectinivorans TaxID=682526 RepID=A0A4R2GAJ0_9BACT|nr:serine hydrolase [Natronoflexus pectinivorans]TCO04965.1 beta-lactamase [Natronoflexus pectinivorans]
MFIVFTTMLILSTWFILPYYLKRAIIHQHPGIYDYEIFPNRTIETNAPQPWPASSLYGIPIFSDEQKDSVELMKTTAFLVISNDSLIFEYYADDDDKTSISNSFSVAKSIIGLLIGAAIDDGYIKNLHLPIEELLPDYTNLHGQGLTLEHLLTMSSGTDWDEAYSSAFSITTKAYYGNDLNALMHRITVTDSPGSTFNYRSGDTQLLATILTRVTGMTVSQYASQKLWQPMGAETPALWSIDREHGMEKAYCCFNSNARDFARIGQLILNNGNWKGNQIIPEKYIQKSITPASHLKDRDGNLVDFYGYQWWIMQYNGEKIPYARGILGQYIFIVPSINTIIVRLGHERSEIRIEEHPIDAYIWLKTGIDLHKQIYSQ